MRIDQLTCQHFRLLHEVPWQFHPHLNLIHGENGSGKTALLEALFFLGRGRSFRETQTRHLIAYQQSAFRLIARLADEHTQHTLGIERQIRDYTLRLDGETLPSLSSLASLMPIQIINADHFALIDQGPEHRRRFLDYGLFYHERDFLKHWQHYQYALKNRNAALREHWQEAHIRPWHPILARSAEQIDQQRRSYLLALEAELNRFHHELGGLETLHIRYLRGWPEDASLQEILDKHLKRDQQLKHTRDGIHRAEWRITTDGHDVAHHFSRGQQKTLLCALILAQSSLIGKDTDNHPVILVDDMAAELDTPRQQLLLRFLQQSGSQLFITSIAPMEKALAGDAKVFKLDQGHATQK